MIRLSALSLALLTTSVLAQETQQQSIIPLTGTGTYETVPLDGYVTQPGQPVPAQPQQTGAYVQSGTGPALKARHGDWEIRCVNGNDCVMTQLHRRSEQSADAVFTIIKTEGLNTEDGLPVEAFAEIVVPLGVYLPGGLGLKVDQKPAQAAPFERCIDAGCVVRAPLSAELLTNMRAGNIANIVVFGAPDQPVQIPISLSGFTAAFSAL